MKTAAERTEPRPERLYLLAQGIAQQLPGFFDVKEAGAGDHSTAEFMELLRKCSREFFGRDYSEVKPSSSAKYAVDFFFPDEKTVVEVALGLRNPSSEFERDIFKCLLAREEGLTVERLLFISKPGGLSRQGTPTQKAIIKYVKTHFELEIEILELEEPLSEKTIPSGS